MFFLHYLIELMFLELVVKVSFSFDSSSTAGFVFNSLRVSLLTVLRVVLFGFWRTILGSKGSSFLLIKQYEMPFINKNEATKRPTKRPKNKRQIYKCHEP